MVLFSFLEAQPDPTVHAVGSSKVKLTAVGLQSFTCSQQGLRPRTLFFGGPKVPEWPIPVSHRPWGLMFDSLN